MPLPGLVLPRSSPRGHPSIRTPATAAGGKPRSLESPGMDSWGSPCCLSNPGFGDGGSTLRRCCSRSECFDKVGRVHAASGQADSPCGQTGQQHLAVPVHGRDITKEELDGFSVRLGLIAAGLDSTDEVARELSIDRYDRPRLFFCFCNANHHTSFPGTQDLHSGIQPARRAKREAIVSRRRQEPSLPMQLPEHRHRGWSGARTSNRETGLSVRLTACIAYCARTEA
jgi:hypothetical protein